jgi:hypothetical protein
MGSPEPLEYLILSFDKELMPKETRNRVMRLDECVSFLDGCKDGRNMLFGFKINLSERKNLLNKVSGVVGDEAYSSSYFRSFSDQDDIFDAFIERRREGSTHYWRYSYKKGGDN